MMYCRRCSGLTLLDHGRNETIREEIEVKNTIMDDITEKQVNRYGYLQRMEEGKIPLRVRNWIIAQRNKQGRPREKWYSSIYNEMENRCLLEGDCNNRKL